MLVESYAKEPSLDKENASKQGRNIADIDADADTILVDETANDQGMHDDEEMFDTSVLEDEEDVLLKEAQDVQNIVEKMEDKEAQDVQNIVEKVIEDITTAGIEETVSTDALITTADVTPNELNMAQALVEIKKSKLKTEFDEQDKLAEEKAQVIEDENLAWDNVQAMMDAYYELAAKLQEEEQKELTIKEKSRLFMELMDKRNTHFAKLRAEEKRRKPLTKAQKRNQMYVC
nr:hypothetical protein [Tanacetum cinerariifolium]